MLTGSRRITTIAALAVVLSAGVFAYLQARGPERPRNVLLITVDTLRPDRLGLGGYDRDTSPELDALARDGRVFTNCRSVSGWTLPSVATLLTGRYPSQHGATNFHLPMNGDLPTLASVLQQAGFSTHAFVSHIFLKPDYGLARGFRTYDTKVLDVGNPHNVSTAAPLTNQVLSALRRLEEPFFVWVHYFDPHFAYLPHANWKSYGDRDSDLYDQEIAHLDRQIGRLLATFRQRGWYDDTAIIFTADHGEEFAEHGGQRHHTLFDEVMRVPLVIRAPGLAPGRDDRPVIQVDLMPTVLSLLGLETGDPAPLPGRDVLAAPRPGSGPRAIFMERNHPPPYHQRSVVRGDTKLTLVTLVDVSTLPEVSRTAPEKVTNVRPGIALFDLANDPGETRNLYEDGDPRAEGLLSLLAEHFSTAATQTGNVPIDDELVKKLRSLGYVR